MCNVVQNILQEKQSWNYKAIAFTQNSYIIQLCSFFSEDKKGRCHGLLLLKGRGWVTKIKNNKIKRSKK